MNSFTALIGINQSAIGEVSVVRHVAANDPEEMPLVECNHMIEAFPAQRSDTPFGVPFCQPRYLPYASRSAQSGFRQERAGLGVPSISLRLLT